MDIAAAGNAILFVCCLVGTVIVSLYVLAYAAFCFLTVLQDTTAGLDEVVWPSEMFFDWLGRAIPIWGIFLLWLTPAGMLARGLRHSLFPDDPALRFFVLAVPGLWLFLPVGLLSALSGETHWLPVRLTILRKLVRILPSLVGFYLSTALLMLAVAVQWYFALFTEKNYLVFVAAAASAALVLIYARLLGRIGWLMGRLKSKKRKPARTEVPKGLSQTLDPWSFPREEEEEPRPKKKKKQKEAAPVETEPQAEIYEIAGQPPAHLPTVTPSDDDEEDDDEPIGLAPLPNAEEKPRPTPDGPPPAGLPAPRVSKIAEELLQRPEPPPPPAIPLFTGVYTFPWYLSTLKAWIWLTLGALAIGVGIQTTLRYWPWK
jgi:hypothetical protein